MPNSDGDCLFHAICLHLEVSTASAGESELMSHVTSLGYSVHSDRGHNVIVLRKLVVRKWLTHESFLTAR